jgi:hypothetical protein
LSHACKQADSDTTTGYPSFSDVNREHIYVQTLKREDTTDTLPNGVNTQIAGWRKYAASTIYAGDYFTSVKTPMKPHGRDVFASLDGTRLPSITLLLHRRAVPQTAKTAILSALCGG